MNPEPVEHPVRRLAHPPRPGPGPLCGVRRVVHIETGGARPLGGVAAALAARGIGSHRIHGGPVADAGDTLITGLADAGEPDAATLKTLHGRLAQLAPDLVCLHDARHARLVHTLARRDRPYLLFWYINDHYPTCLTGGRETREEPPAVCRRRLSMSCLIEAGREHCIRRGPGTGFRMPDLFARLKLLESARSVDAVLVASPFLRETLLAGLPELEHRVHLATPPVSTRPTPPRPTSDPPVIACHAPIAYDHGLHIILAALGRLPRSERLRLHIAGPVHDRDYWAHCRARLRALQETHPAVEARYLETPDGDGLAALYDTTDILVVARLRAGAGDFGAAEMLVRGAAVIATRVGTTHEWLRHGRTGLLIEPGDAGALAAAIARLLHDEPARAELVAAGRWLIGNRFTAHEHLETLATIIAACRARRRPPARRHAAPRRMPALCDPSTC